MALSIRTNVASLDAQRNLMQSQNSLDSAMARLSSGFRITKAGDDAAGLGISTNLEAQIKSYNQASRNANDGLSIIQTAEAALNTTADILSRLRELAMQSASDGVGDSQRSLIQTEVTQLTDEIDRNANSAVYNGTNLLSGTATTLDFQVGINNNATNDRISFQTLDATASTLFAQGNFTLDFSGKASAQSALSIIDNALNTVSSKRATLGAAGNRFEMTIQNIQTFSESLSAADSRIRDVDVAEETSRLSRSQILAQAGISVLAQANQMPQMALKLLG
jgi:flagellin